MQSSRLFLLLLLLPFLSLGGERVPKFRSVMRPPSHSAQLQGAYALSVLEQSVSTMGRVPTDSRARGTITVTAGSRTESGTLTVLTRGTNQTSEHVATPQINETLIFSSGWSATLSSGVLRTLPLEASLGAQSVDFPLPFLASLISDPDMAEQLIGVESVNGVNATHIRAWNTFARFPELASLVNFTTVDIWIDSNSQLPMKISNTRHEASGSAPSLRIDVFFSDYRVIGGAAYPFSIRTDINGMTWALTAIGSVSVNCGLKDQDFPVE